MSTELVVAATASQYHHAEKAVVFASRSYVPDNSKVGCMLMHGGNADAATFNATGGAAFLFARAGLPCASFDNGDATVATGLTSGLLSFGNDYSLEAVGNARTWMGKPNPTGALHRGPGCDPSTVLFAGGSMGCLVTLNYLVSLDDPASICSGVAMTIPVLDMNDIYLNDLGSFRAAIAAAYGIAWPTPLPDLSTHNPVSYSDEAKAKLTMPIHLWASTDDPLGSDTATCEAWAETIGDNVIVTDIGAVGHTTGSLDNNDLLAFLGSCL